MSGVVKALVLPPGAFFLLALIGLALWKRRPRAARWTLGLAGGLFYLFTTPACGSLLLRSLEHEAPWSPARADPEIGAIVVLGGDLNGFAPEFGGATLGALTLERVRYGAALHRATGLPLLVTGGSLKPGTRPIAELMQEALEEELGVPVRWVERQAANTFQNARNSAEMLRSEGIQQTYVVTHAWHLPRALASFESVGFPATPAPTVFRIGPQAKLTEILPSAQGLMDSTHAVHEWLGRLWYAASH